jgi:hypothetical protein
MAEPRHYDTVAFDVRDNAAMLFFAKTTEEGDISDYLLLMRTIEEDFDSIIYIEINEKQVGGRDLIREATLIGNTLSLQFGEPLEELGNVSEIFFNDTATTENGSSMEMGAFRVLGDALQGGTA